MNAALDEGVIWDPRREQLRVIGEDWHVTDAQRKRDPLVKVANALRAEAARLGKRIDAAIRRDPTDGTNHDGLSHELDGVLRARRRRVPQRTERQAVIPYGQQPLAQWQCRACGAWGRPAIVERVSTAGWITFACLMLFCFPLFWVGLLIKEPRASCPRCHVETR